MTVMLKACGDFQKELDKLYVEFQKASRDKWSVSMADFKLNLKNLECAYKGLMSATHYCAGNLMEFGK